MSPIRIQGRERGQVKRSGQRQDQGRGIRGRGKR